MNKNYRVILTHRRPHLDEIATILRLRMCGEKVYPGIKTAEVRYLATQHLPGFLTPKGMERRGVLAVGVGGGDLDEHPTKNHARKENECAATLLENKLWHGGIEKDDRWYRILDEVSHCDRTAQVKPTQLANLVKLRYRHKKDQGSVRRWATDALDALYRTGAHRPERNSCNGLKERFERLAGKFGWVRSGQDPESKTRNRPYDQARQFVAQSQSNAHTCLTELAHLYQCVSRIFPRDVDAWCETILKEIYADCAMFFQAVDLIKDCENITEIDLGTCSVPLLNITSDNELVGKASRSRWTGCYGLTIQLNSKGNVYVSLNTMDDYVRKTGSNLDNFVRMVRYSEGIKEGRIHCWENLAADGTFPNNSLWYYMRHGNTLFNGSLTTPDVSPTKLTSVELEDIAHHAFSEPKLVEWCAKHGIDHTTQAPEPKPPKEAHETTLDLDDEMKNLERVLDASLRE